MRTLTNENSSDKWYAKVCLIWSIEQHWQPVKVMDLGPMGWMGWAKGADFAYLRIKLRSELPTQPHWPQTGPGLAHKTKRTTFSNSINTDGKINENVPPLCCSLLASCCNYHLSIIKIDEDVSFNLINFSVSKSSEYFYPTKRDRSNNIIFYSPKIMQPCKISFYYK